MSLSSRPKLVSAQSTQRQPPPSLFQGPPSHNASNISLQVGLLPNTQGSAMAPTSVLHRPSAHRSTSSRYSAVSSDGNRSLSPFLTRTRSQREVDSAEVLWQEMQNTLAEVELSAFRGEHVFGEEHSKALEELRFKQLKLAQAWTKSEVDDVEGSQEESTQVESTDQKQGTPSAKAAAATTTDSAATYQALEAETEKDLQQARRRRDANDLYFDRVNNGVLDVVASLEEVAEAMREVEQRSKDIWNDTASESAHTMITSTNG
ncbi:hypothetical protein BGW36DRAFT_396854 [Talaromyces proteolyticus]|uniref:Uncharacterized protein n=1 Tax=Talaromyces proteolyticus TaxID=1131652 RepID=A0AAD4Q089_9EURO|nr:uncharacterized protein BGW36DRAFT_396854 [Talaromyces proteolyticus]KAH8697021.1 hypothetical protein BGW36DRAFT_396854 [Talaromyces proteolyticus]